MTSQNGELTSPIDLAEELLGQLCLQLPDDEISTSHVIEGASVGFIQVGHVIAQIRGSKIYVTTDALRLEAEESYSSPVGAARRMAYLVVAKANVNGPIFQSLEKPSEAFRADFYPRTGTEEKHTSELSPTSAEFAGYMYAWNAEPMEVKLAQIREVLDAQGCKMEIWALKASRVFKVIDGSALQLTNEALIALRPKASATLETWSFGEVRDLLQAHDYGIGVYAVRRDGNGIDVELWAERLEPLVETGHAKEVAARVAARFGDRVGVVGWSAVAADVSLYGPSVTIYIIDDECGAIEQPEYWKGRVEHLTLEQVIAKATDREHFLDAVILPPEIAQSHALNAICDSLRIGGLKISLQRTDPKHRPDDSRFVPYPLRHDLAQVLSAEERLASSMLEMIEQADEMVQAGRLKIANTIIATAMARWDESEQDKSWMTNALEICMDTHVSFDAAYYTAIGVAKERFPPGFVPWLLAAAGTPSATMRAKSLERD